jgi:hypothetical protein
MDDADAGQGMKLDAISINCNINSQMNTNLNSNKKVLFKMRTSWQLMTRSMDSKNNLAHSQIRLLQMMRVTSMHNQDHLMMTSNWTYLITQLTMWPDFWDASIPHQLKHTV